MCIRDRSVADYLAANGYNAEISVYPTGDVQAYKDAEGAYAATSQNCLLYTSRCV